jgi:hypothetical protein
MAAFSRVCAKHRLNISGNSSASTGGVRVYVSRRVSHTCVGYVLKFQTLGRSSSVVSLPSVIHTA